MISMLLRCAYNIVRMLQMEASDIPDVIICSDLDLGLKMIFTAIPGQY